MFTSRGKIMKKVIEKCPVCGRKLQVTRLSCKSCGIDITGEFDNGMALHDLDEKEFKFMIDFVRCSGNIKEMERLYNLSYPTVKKKMDLVIEKLGGAIQSNSYDKEILQKVKSKEMTVEEAVKALKKDA